jgi:hypothetical protein
MRITSECYKVLRARGLIHMSPIKCLVRGALIAFYGRNIQAQAPLMSLQRGFVV